MEEKLSGRSRGSERSNALDKFAFATGQDDLGCTALDSLFHQVRKYSKEDTAKSYYEILDSSRRLTASTKARGSAFNARLNEMSPSSALTFSRYDSG